MNTEAIFQSFILKVSDDAVIGPSHIALFVAILYNYRLQGKKSPISVYRRDLVRFSKISVRTYHRCMQDLAEHGYIKYLPSFNPIHGSLVYLS